MSDLYSEFKSRPKKIYIELRKQHHFVHGPLEGDLLDTRFFGRKQPLKRLISILNNSETKSGTYLITGYRGMGKTSFVNKVVRELSLDKFYCQINNVLKIIVFSGFLMFLFSVWFYSYSDNGINNSEESNILVLFLGVTLFISLLLTYWQLRRKKNNFKDLINLLCSLRPNIKYKRFLAFLWLIFVNFLILSVVFLTVLKVFDNNLSFIFLLIYLILAVLFEVLILASVIVEMPFFEFWKRYLNFSDKIFVRLNLGQEDITPKEVYKLLTKNLQLEYNKFLKSFLKNRLKRITIYLFVFVMVFIFLKNDTVFMVTNNIKEQLKLWEYLPSQFNAFVQEYVPDSTIKKFGENLYSAFKDSSIGFSTENYYLIMKKYNFLFKKYSDNKDSINSYINTKNIKKEIESLTLGLKSPDTKLNKFIKLIARSVDYILFILLAPLGKIHIYYYLLYYVLALIMLHFIFNFKIFGFKQVKIIKSKLDELEDIINASVEETKDRGILSRTLLGFSFLYRRKKIFPKAETGELEARLLEILSLMSKSSMLYGRADIIFIFDELDKIQGQPDNSENPLSYDSSVYISRSKKVMELLSGLKYFLSQAQAKFIFIAGREMFDAALADVADRDFFIHSIFNEVIYLKSFLSDESVGELVSVTSMTERYVCNFLMDEEFDKCTLKSFNQYLSSLESFFIKSDNNVISIINRQRQEKIIMTLLHFITYLTHVSNGAPNKLSSYFNSFIEEVSLDEIKVNDNLVVYSKEAERFSSDKRFFLAFNFEQQYQIGLIHYLVSPIMKSISNKIKDYNDKLLVSMTFILDHIFKYYKFAFSWKSLELTPEVFDINKTPEIRNFINQIISFMKQNHIDEIVSGFYSLKFPKRLASEISFLTRISEEAAASFSFSLEEYKFIHSKYQKLLNQIQQSGDLNKNEYNHIIAWLHSLLGDLNYLEERFDDALREYLSSVQHLRYLDPDKLSLTQLLLFSNNMLKLGLVLEHRKSFDIAFTVFNELVAKIINFRTIKISRFGLVEKTTSKKSVELYLSNTPVHDKLMKDLVLVKVPDSYFRSEYYKFNDQVIPEVKLKTDFDLTIEEFYENLLNRLTPEKHQVLSKLSAFEGIRVFYIALLAKFQIIEKSNLGGISYYDLKRVLSEFNFLKKVIKQEENFLIISDFYKKVADILFYKNVDFNLQGLYDDNIKGQVGEQCQKKTYFSEKFCKKSKSWIKHLGYKTHCSACFFYRKSIITIIKQVIDWDIVLKDAYFQKDKVLKSLLNKGENKIKSEVLETHILWNLPYILLKALSKKAVRFQRKNTFKALANFLSDYGDVLLGCSIHTDEISSHFLENLFDFIKCKKPDKLIDSRGNTEKTFSRLEQVLLYYYLSGKFYKKAALYKEYATQLTKIIYVFKEYIAVFDSGQRKKALRSVLPLIEDILIPKIIRATHAAYDNNLLSEIEELKQIFSDKRKGRQEVRLLEENISLKNLNTQVDYQEALILLADLKVSIFSSENSKSLRNQELKKLYIKNIVSPYSMVNSMYNYILQLRHKAHINFKLYKELISSFESNRNKESTRSFIELKGNKLDDFIKRYYKDFYKSIYELEPDSDSLKHFEDFQLFYFLIKLLNEYDKNNEELEKTVILGIQKQMSLNGQRITVQAVLDTLEFLIVDSVYDNYMIIKLIDIFGKSFMFTHSTIGFAHQKLMEWIGRYKNFVFVYELLHTSSKEMIKKKLDVYFSYFLYIYHNKLLEEIRFLNLHNELLVSPENYSVNNHLNKLESLINKLDSMELKESKKILNNIYHILEKIKQNEDIKSLVPKYTEAIKQFYNKMIELLELLFDSNYTLKPKLREIINDLEFNIDKKLSELIGEDFMNIISKIYQTGRAKKEFYSAVETHTSGKAYMDMIENMSYLNDDFNDRSFHFFTALERYRLNTGYINLLTEKQKASMKYSSIFRFESNIQTLSSQDDRLPFKIYFDHNIIDKSDEFKTCK